MRVALVVAVIVALAGTAGAERTSPIRITIACEDDGRTKVCSAFLLALVEGNKLFLSSPRSSAEVVIYVTANEIALVDRVHLRFVGTIVGAPPVVELDVDLDTRADDDTQRAQLEPAFNRGIALFVAARHPKSVAVTLSAPDDLEVTAPSTTPLGFSIGINGSGNYTEQYRSYSGGIGLEVSRVTRRDLLIAELFANGGRTHSPPLQIDGQEVSLDTERWSFGSNVGAAWLYNRCWSLGGVARTHRGDDKAQFRHQTSVEAGIEWDRFLPDDPRGNRLAILYTVGYQVERYNLRNEVGETFAHYATHELTASGSVRKDKVSVGVSLSLASQLLDPALRHSLSASPYIEWQLGNHIDLNLGFSIAKRELPGPDESAIDPSDFEQLQRLSYADPLQMSGYLNVRIHWDRTNGARNDRFNDI
ncbi:MAG: hypothetical protein M3680_21820 [Myxococcota bacterium]|nr:hypothetical protein [Myxococcota bacterium]